MGDAIGLIIGAIMIAGEFAMLFALGFFFVQAWARPDPAARDRAAMITLLIVIALWVRTP